MVSDLREWSPWHSRTESASYSNSLLQIAETTQALHAWARRAALDPELGRTCRARHASGRPFALSETSSSACEALLGVPGGAETNRYSSSSLRASKSDE